MGLHGGSHFITPLMYEYSLICHQFPWTYPGITIRIITYRTFYKAFVKLWSYVMGYAPWDMLHGKKYYGHMALDYTV